MRDAGSRGALGAALGGAIVGAAVATAAMWALLGPAPVARAAGVGGVQHKVVAIDFDEYKDLPEYKQAEKSLGSAFAAVLHMQEIALNNLGQDGWELVQVDGKTASKCVFYLKREVGAGGK